jgi:lipoprotein-anchoring transpeptidase ErfK/SrfK
MLQEPAWIHPLTGMAFPASDSHNPLGHYWIAFWTDGKDCIGFHGTRHPKTVGKPSSHGCIRMYDKDIEELFWQVRLGTPVTVAP